MVKVIVTPSKRCRCRTRTTPPWASCSPTWCRKYYYHYYYHYQYTCIYIYIYTYSGTYSSVVRVSAPWGGGPGFNPHHIKLSGLRGQTIQSLWRITCPPPEQTPGTCREDSLGQTNNIYIYICFMHRYVCVSIHLSLSICIYVSYIHTCVYISLSLYIYTYTHVYIYIYIYTL